MDKLKLEKYKQMSTAKKVALPEAYEKLKVLKSKLAALKNPTIKAQDGSNGQLEFEDIQNKLSPDETGTIIDNESNNVVKPNQKLTPPEAYEKFKEMLGRLRKDPIKAADGFDGSLDEEDYVAQNELSPDNSGLIVDSDEQAAMAPVTSEIADENLALPSTTEEAPLTDSSDVAMPEIKNNPALNDRLQQLMDKRDKEVNTAQWADALSGIAANFSTGVMGQPMKGSNFADSAGNRTKEDIDAYLKQEAAKNKPEMTAYQKAMLNESTLNRNTRLKALEESLNARQASREDNQAFQLQNKYFQAKGTIEKDPIIKKLNDQNISLGETKQLLDMAKDGNGMAFAAMAPKYARALGEVGVLTDGDISRYTTNPALVKKVKDTLNKWKNGIPADETMKDLDKVVSVLSTMYKDNYNNKLQKRYDTYVNSFAKSYGRPLEEVYANLDIPNPNVEIKAEKSNSSNDKVVVEKDGKKFKLPKSQLNSALKQGYTEVK